MELIVYQAIAAGVFGVGFVVSIGVVVFEFVVVVVVVEVGLEVVVVVVDVVGLAVVGVITGLTFTLLIVKLTFKIGNFEGITFEFKFLIKLSAKVDKFVINVLEVPEVALVVPLNGCDCNI